MNASAIPARRPASSKPHWGLRLLVVAAFFLVVIVLVFWAIAMFGSVSGREFSPISFERRSFSYIQLPLLGVQVTPVSRDLDSGDLETFLTAQKIVTPGSGARWDYISGREGAKLTPEGDASILGRYLDARAASNELFWLTWSKQNPKLARVLWPAVAEAGRKQVYVFIPALMDEAKTAKSAAVLQKQLKRVLAEQYAMAAANQQRSGQLEAALQFYTEALSYAPQDASLLRKRAEIHQELGKAQAAAADREAARTAVQEANEASLDESESAEAE